MLSDRQMKHLLAFNEGKFDHIPKDLTQNSPCGWCGTPLGEMPYPLPLGGEARFFKSEECHAMCFDDMLEDWKKAGQWKGLRSYQSKMAPRRGIHLVLAAIWK